MIKETKLCSVVPDITNHSSKPLTESLSFQIISGGVDHSQLCETLCGEWGNAQYAPLAALCSCVIALGRIHQAHHWQAKSDTFYGDHLLFERLYNDVLGEIDSLGERTIGLGSIELVNPVIQQHQVARLVQVYSAGNALAMPQTQELVNGSYMAEMHFLRMIEIVKGHLGEGLTYGTDNLLAGIADKHEEHVYLLKQRLMQKE